MQIVCDSITESSTSIHVRDFVGWWFVGGEVSSIRQSSPSSSLSTPNLLTWSNLAKESWTPLVSLDNDRVERAYQDRNLCDLPNAVVVHEDNGQRLSKICLENMRMEKVYWESVQRAVRRSTWIYMMGADAAAGGNPLPSEWDKVLLM